MAWYVIGIGGGVKAMQQIDFYMVDAFTYTTFGGNAAARAVSVGSMLLCSVLC